jgi:hypothetical protein
MPAPAIREMLHHLRQLQPVCWLSESHALSVSGHYTLYLLYSLQALIFLNIRQSSADMRFKTCTLRHCLQPANTGRDVQSV